MNDKMDGLFIFDQQNDVIFTKINDKMKMKLLQMCKNQELIGDNVIIITATINRISILLSISSKCIILFNLV